MPHHKCLAQFCFLLTNFATKFIKILHYVPVTRPHISRCTTFFLRKQNRKCLYVM
jgi:hypothetical protein